MPKKTTTARGGAQRHRARASKSFEVVHPGSKEKESEAGSSSERAAVSVSTSTGKSTATPKTTMTSAMVVPEAVTEAEAPSNAASTGEVVSPKVRRREVPSGEQDGESAASTSAMVAPKGSAAARLAARRQNAQKVQQRSAPSLITAEHYAYVRRDLIFIAILAIIMFSVIIILHFVPAIGG